MVNLKNIAIIVPFILVSIYYIRLNYAPNFPALTVVEIIINHLPIYLVILVHLYYFKTDNWLKKIVQACLYVYLYCLYFYTVSYIPYHLIFTNSILPSELWVTPRFNLVPFNIFKTSVTSFNLVGNLILLLPLGIMVPILHIKFRRYINFLIAAFIVVFLIELGQLFGSFISGIFSPYEIYSRSFDVDDFIFNLFGATIGFILFKIIVQPILNKWI